MWPDVGGPGLTGPFSAPGEGRYECSSSGPKNTLVRLDNSAIGPIMSDDEIQGPVIKSAAVYV